MYSEKNMMNTLFVAALALEQFDATYSNRQLSQQQEYQNNDCTGGGDVQRLRTEKNIHALAQRSNITPAAVAAILAARNYSTDGGSRGGENNFYKGSVNADCHARRHTAVQCGTLNEVDELAVNASCDIDCESNSNTISLDIDDDDDDDDIGDQTSDENESIGNISQEPSITNSRSVEYFVEAAALVPQQRRPDTGGPLDNNNAQPQEYETLVWNPQLVDNNSLTTTGKTEAAHPEIGIALCRQREEDEQVNNNVNEEEAELADQIHRLPLRQLVKLLRCASRSGFMTSAGSHDLAIERVYRKIYECGGSYKTALDALMSPLSGDEFELLRQKVSVEVNMDFNDDDADNNDCAVAAQRSSRR